MIRHAWLAVFGVLGCREPAPPGTQGAPAADLAATRSRDAEPAPSRVITATHSAQVTVVAVSDGAEAALSLDEHGELRFWPSLDGAHEPVVVHGRPSSDLAITREHDGYLAALLDNAHGIELVRLGADGAVRGRQVIAADPGFAEIVAGDATLLGRALDHRIVRLDANQPRSKGVLAPEPGEQILAIAARHRVAIAAIADPERPGEIHVVRQIVLTAELAWGTATTLPVPLRAPIAVSPSGNRVAGFNARTNSPVIVELGPVPRVIATESSTTDSEDDALGFLDDDHAVFRGSFMSPPPVGNPPLDPWNTPRSTVRIVLGTGPAVADGVVVAGHGTSLEITNTTQRRYLGYRDVGIGYLRTSGAQITLNFGSRMLWLDAALAVVRAKTIELDVVGGLAVSDRQLLKTTATDLDDRSALEVFLVDVVTGTEQRLGRWSPGSAVAYDPDTSVFAVMGETKTIARIHLDVATGKTTPLRPLRAGENATVALLDPARAAGVVAVTYTFDDELRLDTFIDDHKGTRALAPASSHVISEEVSVVGTDLHGTTYTISTALGDAPKPVDGYRGGKRVTRVLVDGQATMGVVDHLGTRLAIVMAGGVAVVDLDGVERWRAPLWQVNAVEFTADGRTLLANTQGGLVAIDAATGQRRGTACSWNFGLSAEEPSTAVFLAPAVCAEALDQTGTP